MKYIPIDMISHWHTPILSLLVNIIRNHILEREGWGWEGESTSQTHPTFHSSLLPICLSNSHLPLSVSFSHTSVSLLLTYFLLALEMGFFYRPQPKLIYIVASLYFIFVPYLSPTSAVVRWRQHDHVWEHFQCWYSHHGVRGNGSYDDYTFL